MLVAPTELRHPVFRALTTNGRGSNKPEDYGCDFLFVHKREFYGVQRKELKDFVASANDGRLGQEVAQMQDCALAILVVEGAPRWANDGQLMLNRWTGRWTEARHYGVLWGMAKQGVSSYSTNDVAGTARIVTLFEKWVKKEKHGSLEVRPTPRDSFGHTSREQRRRHILMGIPGVGVELADRLTSLDQFPLALTCDDSTLLAVEGIGAGKLKKIKEVFDDTAG